MLSTAIRSDINDMQLLITINRQNQTSTTTILTVKQLDEEMDLIAKFSNREMHKSNDCQLTRKRAGNAISLAHAYSYSQCEFACILLCVLTIVV